MITMINKRSLGSLVTAKTFKPFKLFVNEYQPSGKPILLAQIIKNRVFATLFFFYQLALIESKTSCNFMWEKVFNRKKHTKLT